MKNSKHTLEPWRVWDEPSPSFRRRNLYRYITGGDGFVAYVAGKGEIGEVNAARIVACVNALAGIDPSAVKDLLAACKGLLSHVTGSNAGLDESRRFMEAKDAARAAIRKAEGGGQ